jgi:hypothetical protein
VQQHAEHKDDLKDGQGQAVRDRRGTHRPQPGRVRVVVSAAVEDLEVPERVGDQEEEEDNPGDGHDGLLADRRPVKAQEPGAVARLR